MNNLNKTTKYALQVLSYLGQFPGEVKLSREIAENTEVPLAYCEKVVRILVKNKFVQSQKGWGGGFMLVEQTLQKSISEVALLFEAAPNQEGCVFGLGGCNPNKICPLHKKWQPAAKRIQKFMSEVTVKNVIDLSRHKFKKASLSQSKTRAQSSKK